MNDVSYQNRFDALRDMRRQAITKILAIFFAACVVVVVFLVLASAVRRRHAAWIIENALSVAPSSDTITFSSSDAGVPSVLGENYSLGTYDTEFSKSFGYVPGKWKKFLDAATIKGIPGSLVFFEPVDSPRGKRALAVIFEGRAGLQLNFHYLITPLDSLSGNLSGSFTTSLIDLEPDERAGILILYGGIRNASDPLVVNLHISTDGRSGKVRIPFSRDLHPIAPEITWEKN